MDGGTSKLVALAGLVALSGGVAAVAAPVRAAVPVRAAGVAHPAADVGPPVTTAYLTSLGATRTRVRLEASDPGTGSVTRTLYRVDGGAWRTYRQPAPYVAFDGSRASFKRWQHIGAGAFRLQRDGTMRTVGGLGMLWWPVRQFGSAEIHLRWRALPPPKGTATTASRGNSGVVIRFPDPVAMVNDATKHQPCQAGVGLGSLGLFLPEWAALDCGNEIQINDHSPADPQRTGSVYDFDFLHDPQERPVPLGQWTDYVVKVVGGGQYSVTVVRDGHVINQWVNTPGQLAWRSGCYCGLPVEAPGDPPSDLRQFAQGYFGLQNHGDTDVVEFGRVTVRDLSGKTGAFTVSGRGGHVVQFGSVDAAGNAEPVQTLRFTVGEAGGPIAASTVGTHSCTAGPVVAGMTRTTCHYVATGDGTYDAQTTSIWSIRVTHRVGRTSTTTLVATHTSAPSLPVRGTFHAAKGDIVTVTLGPDLNTSRDSNVPLDGATGSVAAGDTGTVT